MRNSTQRQPTNDSTRRLLTTPPPPPPTTTSESIIGSCWSILTFHATHRHLIPSARTTNISSFVMITTTFVQLHRSTFAPTLPVTLVIATEASPLGLDRLLCQPMSRFLQLPSLAIVLQ